jgi:TetR/AcrR family transcriptional regulator
MPATGCSAPNNGGEGGEQKGSIRQSNEAKILRAAERIFARAGFAGARVAEIAALAGIPKANLHYYFRSKRDLYRAVLDNILRLWLAETRLIDEGGDPRAAIEHYVRMKMRFSRLYPDASRVFATEIIAGAPELKDYLRADLRDLVDRKSAVLTRWIEAGRMAPVDPRQLFFAIWAITQTYADFDAQICAVLDVESIGERDFEVATEQVVALILRACGFYYAVPPR